jgi:tetratricopeptide (TPR) repeat protein
MNTQEKIDRYVRGKLDPDEIDSLWVEIAKDPELMEQVKTEYALHELMAGKQNKAKVYRLSDRIWYGAAAAAVLLVVMLQFLGSGEPNYPFNTIELNQNQIEGSQVYRNDDEARLADSLLILSAQAIMDFDFAPAEMYIMDIRPEMDSLIYAKAQFNRGLIYFIKRDFETASQAFNESLEYAIDDKLVMEKNYWFLANISIRKDKIDVARDYANQTIRLDGLYSNDAQLMLQYLDEQEQQQSAAD